MLLLQFIDNVVLLLQLCRHLDQCLGEKDIEVEQTSLSTAENAEHSLSQGIKSHSVVATDGLQHADSMTQSQNARMSLEGSSQGRVDDVIEEFEDDFFW